MYVITNMIYSVIPNIISYKYTCKNSDKTSFKGGSASNFRFSGIKRISSEREYDDVFKHLLDNKQWSGWWNKGDKFEKGLMPYIGEQDISYRINNFLRNGKPFDNSYSSDTLTSIIRLIDYALMITDKLYGTYEGIVYRYGKLDMNAKGFTSTAREPEGAVSAIPYNDVREFSNPFYIIDVKNGHRIENIQKKLKYNDCYMNESEILLRPSVFTEITEITVEMKEAEQKLRQTLNKEHYRGYPDIHFCKEID